MLLIFCFTSFHNLVHLFVSKIVTIHSGKVIKTIVNITRSVVHNLVISIFIIFKYFLSLYLTPYLF